MPGLEDRSDAVAGLDALELHSPHERDGVSAPMEEDSAALLEEQRRARAAQMDKASALIGQRMLQGWAMLDMSCPRCYSPIMRDRQRQLWCVACDMRVVDKSEQGGASGQAESAPHPKRKTSPEVPREAAMENGGEEELERGAKRQATDTALSAQQAVVPGTLDLKAVSNGLRSSLIGKLEGFREAIQKCQDPNELCLLLDVIHKCAATIKVVNELATLP